MASRHKYMYFDLLSIIASFAVICLHCNGIVHWGPQVPHWSQALVVEVVCYWAVPIFFMCTGAKTLAYRDHKTTKAFLISRFKGIFFPFFIWCVIQYCIKASGLLNPRPLDWSPSFSHFWQLFMSGQIDGTYWFFFAMFGVTLSIPVLSRLREHTDTLWYLVIAYVFLSGVVLPASKVFGIPWNSSLTIATGGGYVMYAALGFLLANDHSIFNSSKRRLALYLGGGLAFAARYGYTWFFSLHSGELNNTLFDYTYITAILPAVAVFVFFRHVPWETISFFNRFSNGIRAIAGLTFGVYLMHYFVLNDFFVQHLGWDMASYRVRLLLPFIVFCLCLAVSGVLNKIPHLRAIVGGWR